MLLTQTAVTDYEELCKLDVLGIQDKGDQTDAYDDFKEQLYRDWIALERKPSYVA